MNPEISEKQSDTYLAAAMLAPLAQASSGCSWPVTFLLSALCLGAAQWLSCHALPQGKLLKLLQSLWTCVLGALAGGLSAARRPGSRGLLTGLGVGLVLFLLLLTAGLLAYEDASLERGGAAVLCACLCGGGLAGLIGGRRPKKKRKR